jgi:delta-aminolevulinic acid dehydratase/porphobilinogen synthase
MCRLKAALVRPVAMLDFSVKRARRTLDDHGFRKAWIMPNLISDSRLYEGYRTAMDASPASGDRRRFQLDPEQRRRHTRPLSGSSMRGRTRFFWGQR